MDKTIEFLSESLQPANKSTCLDVEKEARVSGREVLSATGRFFVTTSRGLPSPPSVVWLAVVV